MRPQARFRIIDGTCNVAVFGCDNRPQTVKHCRRLNAINARQGGELGDKRYTVEEGEAHDPS